MSVLLTIALSAFCDDLTAGAQKGQTYVIAPIEGPDEKDNVEAESRIAKCFGSKVITSRALQASVGEAQLKAAMGKDDNLRDMALSFGSRRLVVTSLKAKSALVRVVNAENGEVLSAARLMLDESAAFAPLTLNASLQRLSERLAASFKVLPSASKKRIAVLPFKENGEQSTKNALGTLVSAELVTRFRRDHDFAIVERARLDSVLKEMELAQLGMVDEKNAPKLGRLVEADVIVIGSTLDAGPSVKVYAQVIDVESGVTLVADNTDFQAASLVALSSDAVVLRSKSGAMFRSVLIPGWGQLYNRQPAKGYAFLATALALAAGGGVLQGMSALAANDYARATSDFDVYANRAETFQIAATATFCTLGVFWIANVIEAYVSGTTFDSATSQ